MKGEREVILLCLGWHFLLCFLIQGQSGKGSVGEIEEGERRFSFDCVGSSSSVSLFRSRVGRGMLGRLC